MFVKSFPFSFKSTARPITAAYCFQNEQRKTRETEWRSYIVNDLVEKLQGVAAEHQRNYPPVDLATKGGEVDAAFSTTVRIKILPCCIQTVALRHRRLDDLGGDNVLIVMHGDGNFLGDKLHE
jgi:hypothetical protein